MNQKQFYKELSTILGSRWSNSHQSHRFEYHCGWEHEFNVFIGGGINTNTNEKILSVSFLYKYRSRNVRELDKPYVTIWEVRVKSFLEILDIIKKRKLEILEIIIKILENG